MSTSISSSSESNDLRRAVMYVHSSKEHQQFSTENQAKVIKVFAKRHGYEIVKTYMDGNGNPTASSDP